MLAIGDCLQNRYRVIRQLGHGGMGTVYEAHDERFENSVALKEVLIDLAKIADPAQQQMVSRAFEREAKTLALLHHEAFPHVIDYFSERDHQYLIMELVRGEDLGEQLQSRKKPFEFEEVLDWTKQLLDALDYLHTQEQPIIHRDLKPQNMKITNRGKVKVLDFGIAKGADSKSSSTITNQTFVAATLNYSPIEQLLRVLDPTFREFISQRHKEKVEDILQHTADARSDLYSLGATLYQLLTATQPHDTLKRALDIWAGKPDPLPNPMELNPRIPPHFNQILLKSMQIDRDSRYVSAAEMQQAIKDYLKAESQTQDRANQAAWLAEQQQQTGNNQNAQNQNAQSSSSGMQTQLRIAEELKYLDELGSPTVTKLNTAASIIQPSAPAAPPVNEAEDRRRIAEQQKFLAELGDLNEQVSTPNPVQPSALTDYGQISQFSGSQAADQTNYSNVQPPSDQTQVSYLANSLPPVQAKAAAPIVNHAPRNEVGAPPPVAVQQTAETATKNKMMWLIPVGAAALLLLVGAVAAALFLIPSSKPTANANSSKPAYTPTEATPQNAGIAPTDSPAAASVDSTPRLSPTDTPAAPTTAGSTTGQKPAPTPAPKQREAIAEPKREVTEAKPKAPVAEAPKPAAPKPAAPKPAPGKVADCKITGEC